jgi:hypothetical protein
MKECTLLISVARCFQTKNPNLGKFWVSLAMEDVGIFMTILSTLCTVKWYILLPFGTFYGFLVYFSRFGVLYREKSGNPSVNILQS